MTGVTDLFPCGSQNGKPTACSEKELRDIYQSVPGDVIKAADYRKSDGSLDFPRLESDFACMSYVGVRGYSQEEGLLAATRAVSPKLTGGPAGNPYAKGDKAGDYTFKKSGEQAPNHGFLRDDAKLAVIFVTDENDCSVPDADRKNETLEKRYGCGEMNCYYPTKGDDQTPLYSTQRLAEAFRKNLRLSKRTDNLSKEDIFIASIHGKSKPYDGKIQTTEEYCGNTKKANNFKDNLTTCSGKTGASRSGDRYEAFLLNFDNHFPEAAVNGKVKGWMCDASLGRPLNKIAEALKTKGQACIRRPVLGCEKTSQCPSHRYPEKAGRGTCSPWGASKDRKFCESAIQVRLKVNDSDSKPSQIIKQMPGDQVCYPGSIATDDFPDGCVVRRKYYEWIPCPGAKEDGIKLEWKNISQAPSRKFADFKVQIRYSEAAGPDQQSGSSGSGPDASSGGSSGGNSGGGSTN